VVVRQRPTEQAHLVLGVPGVAQRDDSRWALRVLDSVLGGGMSSRLFQHVREDRGLAYSTYSYATSYSDAGLFGAYVGTSPGRVDEVLSVVRNELDAIADDLDVDEVERAKGALTGHTVLALEDTASRMSRLGQQAIAGDELVTVDEALRRIAAVEVDDVRAIARAILGRPRDLALVGPFAPEESDRFTAAVR
jgi:predicted Zn-dependent peptidase